jgi:hypothetical protein
MIEFMINRCFIIELIISHYLFGEEVDCQIRFDSLEYSEKNAKRFKIKLNSWYNIELISADKNSE